jgi:hypothetical protein
MEYVNAWWTIVTPHFTLEVVAPIMLVRVILPSLDYKLMSRSFVGVVRHVSYKNQVIGYDNI